VLRLVASPYKSETGLYRVVSVGRYPDGLIDTRGFHILSSHEIYKIMARSVIKNRLS
jgi:hypothetical protein